VGEVAGYIRSGSRLPCMEAQRLNEATPITPSRVDAIDQAQL